MEGEVVLTETATIWLIEIDGDCLLSETDADISEEDRRDLASPKRQTNPLLIKGRATQTITAPMVSEKEQTTPLILKVSPLRSLVSSVCQIPCICTQPRNLANKYLLCSMQSNHQDQKVQAAGWDLYGKHSKPSAKRNVT